MLNRCNFFKVFMTMLTIVLVISVIGCTRAAASSGSTEINTDTSSSVEPSVAESEEDLPVLKVAVIPFLNSIPIKYIVDNGLDVENGFKIEIVSFSTGGAMNEALAADEWEVGTLSAAAVNSLAIYGAYNVADIGHAEGGQFMLCSADSPIAQVKGSNPSYPDVYGDEATVKGITITTLTGSISHLNAIKWLEALGMTTDDVNIVSADFSSSYQALVTGNCDVAGLAPPTSYQAESEGYIVVASLSALDVPQYDSIICSAKAYNERRDIVVKYIKAFFEVNDALQADPDMAAQLLLDWYDENGSESNLEACEVEVANRPFITVEEAKTIKVGESVQVTGEFWVSQGLLEANKFPEIAPHIDDSLVKEALGY